MIYRLNNNGFGLIPVLLIILIMIAAGFSGYYVYKQENKSESSKPTSSEVKTEENKSETSAIKDPEAQKETLPTGWKKTSSAPLGFEFPYPEEWGEPEIKKLEMPHTGKAYEIAFSAQDIYGMMISADYKYTGEGRGTPSWYISQPFEKQYSSILEADSSLEVLKKNSYSIIDISFNCVDGGVPQKLTSKLPKGGFDVLAIAENKPLNVPTCDLKPGDKPSIYADSKTTDQFETLAKLLNE